MSVQAPSTDPVSTDPVSSGSDAARWAYDVQQALARMDPAQEKLLRLSYWHGLTHDLIGHQLNLPRSQVSTLIANAMRSLAATLEGEHGSG
jgi:RNA polymerase sigma factor (sigma-70 family)